MYSERGEGTEKFYAAGTVDVRALVPWEPGISARDDGHDNDDTTEHMLEKLHFIDPLNYISFLKIATKRIGGTLEKKERGHVIENKYRVMYVSLSLGTRNHTPLHFKMYHMRPRELKKKKKNTKWLSYAPSDRSVFD